MGWKDCAAWNSRIRKDDGLLSSQPKQQHGLLVKSFQRLSPAWDQEFRIQGLGSSI